MTKVYCRDCKKICFENNYCREKMVIEETPFQPKTIGYKYSPCSVFNSMNDCCQFLPTLSFRLKTWLKNLVKGSKLKDVNKDRA